MVSRKMAQAEPGKLWIRVLGGIELGRIPRREA
jgi:hypothetical protein